MKLDEPKLERLKIKSLRHTSTNPGEWIGMMESGEAIYILAKATKIQVCTGPDLNTALRSAISNGGHMFPNISVEKSGIGTSEMLSATGINFDSVKESTIGEM